MEETNLYAARVQVVEAMEQGLPWHEAAKQAGHETQSINSLSAPPADASRREAGGTRKGGMDIQPNCAAKCASFWKRRAGRLLKRQATKSRRGFPITNTSRGSGFFQTSHLAVSAPT